MSNAVHYVLYTIGLRLPITQTTGAERECLRKYAAGRRRLAEIGVFHGVNTKAFREVMSEDGVLFAVDPFARGLFGLRGYGWARRIARREVSKVRKGAVVWIEKKGKDAPGEVEVRKHLPLDFIFIDGDHSWEGLKGDWESWRPHIIPSGVVALHDTRNRGECGAERYAREVILNDSEFREIEVVDSLTILARTR